MLVVGLMSGTSADGIDAVLVEIEGAPPELRVRLLRHVAVPYEPALREWAGCATPSVRASR